VFAVQDEISASIAGALHTRLSPQDAAKPRYTPKLPAYEALMKARHFHWKQTPEAMASAKTFYEQAIALDPRFALAHAFYADYCLGRTAVGISPMAEAAPVARALAQQALELDSTLPEAHAILCVLAATCDYDWKEAIRRFPLATGDSASPWCHLVCGDFCLLGSGRRIEAVEQLELAVQQDPLHLTVRLGLALCLSSIGRHSEAELHLRQALDIDSHFFLGHLHLALHFIARGMFAEAFPFSEKAFSLAPWHTMSIGVYAGLSIRMGENDRGKELIQRLSARKDYGAPIGLALFHICCDEIDLAADWCEKAIEERYFTVVIFLQSAIAEPLRASPRWPKLAAMVNLPVESGR